MFIYRKLIFYIVIIFLFSSDINARSIIVDAEIDNLLNQYASELYEVSALNTEEIEIYVVLDPSINASVTPKGKIFINTGLIMESDTPNQVSSIIAHEMGHVINNHHITRRIESQIMSKNQIIAQIIGIGAGVSGALSDSNAMVDIGTGITLGGNKIATREFLKYSRQQEYEADMAAVRLMESSGQSSKGLLEVFQKIRASSRVYGDELNRLDLTHDLPEERINLLEIKISEQKSFKKVDSQELIHKYNLVKAKLIGYLGLRDNYDVGSLYSKYINAIRYYQKGKLDLAESAMTDIIEIEESPYFFEFLAQIYRDKFEFEKSLEYIEKSINSLSIRDPQIEMLYADILINIGDTKSILKGIDILESSSINTIMRPKIHWQLSKAYYEIDNISKADLNIAKYYSLIGDLDSAKRFSERAKQGLQYSSPDWFAADDIQNIN